MKHIEHNNQTAFVMRSRAIYPDLLIYATPNGGKRDPREAIRLKAEGVTAGIPDICVCRASGGYNGLYLEFKTKTGRLSDTQRDVLALLHTSGYLVEVVRSTSEAWDVLTEYLLLEVL